MPPRKLDRVCAAITSVALVAVCVCGCSGGSSSGESSLRVVDVLVEDLGSLPLENVFLNSPVTVVFNTDVDPESVSTQTFRMLAGPDFIDLAPGEIVVEGHVVRFVPDLPTLPDLSDGGFEPDAEYRLRLRGLPDLNTIRSKSGRPLVATRTFELTTREIEPFYLDPIAGPPRVIGVFVDLDGSGTLDADGDPATPEEEEFLEGEAFFDESIPLVAGVPVGSASLPPPHAPLLVGLLFSEPIDPATLLEDADLDGVLDAFEVADTTNPYPCDRPSPGDVCPRPLALDLELRQGFDRERGEFVVLATVEFPYPLRPLAHHHVVARSGIEDLRGNRLVRRFAASFETGTRPPLDDFFEETFTSTSGRGPATTALWNPVDQTRLSAGIGFGGDGSDGPFEGTVIDTRRNGGVFNFSEFDTTFDVTVVGDRPAILRVKGDFRLGRSVNLTANGSDGNPGREGSYEPLPGGAAGPGGFPGGTASPDGAESERGAEGGAPEGTEGGGGGGYAGAGPGGGGGAGHRSPGTRGSDGGDASAGEGGSIYGDPTLETLDGGAGGGGGGNNIDPALGGSTGGSGGGGGGILVVEAFGEIDIPAAVPQGVLSANGGKGGQGARPEDGANSGAGGGGSGGAILLRCRTLPVPGAVEAKGKNGGTAVLPAGRGGKGATGSIRIETLAGDARCPTCEPSAVIERIPESMLGKTVGRSDFLLTHAPPGAAIEYSFDGNVATGPLAGRVRFDGEDITVVDENGRPAAGPEDLPPGTVIEVFFRGAFEDPRRPNRPDPATLTPWLADIRQLDGYPALQWEVRFTLGGVVITEDTAEDPPLPGVDDLRVGFRIR